jgi:hypothetical protein
LHPSPSWLPARISLLQLLLQQQQQLLPLCLLLLQHCEASASQQRQQLCQQLRSWRHSVTLLLLRRRPRLLLLLWRRLLLLLLLLLLPLWQGRLLPYWKWGRHCRLELQCQLGPCVCCRQGQLVQGHLALHAHQCSMPKLTSQLAQWLRTREAGRCPGCELVYGQTQQHVYLQLQQQPCIGGSTRC